MISQSVVTLKNHVVIKVLEFDVPVTVINISADGIVFSNGLELSDYHMADCCEHVYADWKALETTGFPQEKFKKLVIKGIKDSGIGLNEYFVPCYNIQNGFYSHDLELSINEEVFDITDYVKDDIF